jgi:hypothetical protein
MTFPFALSTQECPYVATLAVLLAASTLAVCAGISIIAHKSRHSSLVATDFFFGELFTVNLCLSFIESPSL